MKRSELIQKTKEYFRLPELVCPHVYQRDGEKAWRYFPTAALETLVAIREIIDMPMHVNNWDIGGQLSQRGLRCNLCSLVSAKTRGGQLYVSAHMLGQGFDFSCSKPAEEVRAIIRKNTSKLPHPIRLEKDVSWVHVDIYPMDDKKKIVEFNA